jgi:hypothetical protein
MNGELEEKKQRCNGGLEEVKQRTTKKKGKNKNGGNIFKVVV